MTIRTKPVTKAYEEGWERTFGKRSPAVRRERAFRRELAKKQRQVVKAANAAVQRYAR